MSKKRARHFIKSDTTEYHKGYADGMKAAFEESELDAFYAGVGYGKKNAKDKHIGFRNDEERRQFEAGMRSSDKHFRAYRAEPKGFFERLLTGKDTPERSIQYNAKSRSKPKPQRSSKPKSSRRKKK